MGQKKKNLTTNIQPWNLEKKISREKNRVWEKFEGKRVEFRKIGREKDRVQGKKEGKRIKFRKNMMKKE